MGNFRVVDAKRLNIEFIRRVIHFGGKPGEVGFGSVCAELVRQAAKGMRLGGFMGCHAMETG